MYCFLSYTGYALKVGVHRLKIKVLVADDERLAREEIIYFIEQEEDCILCGVAENGEQVLEKYQDLKPDVVFLDIQMPYMSGMDAAKVLFEYKLQQQNTLPLIVFTTAYDAYAIQAFGVDASDYLLKPYDAKKFKAMMARVRRKLNSFQAENRDYRSLEPAKNIVTEAANYQLQKLLVDEGDKLVILAAKDILYAVRQERVVEIHTEKEVVQAKWTLQELEQKLHGMPFYRSHRSYLVNLNYVHEIIPWFNGAYTIVLNDDEKTNIPVSRSSAKELFEILGQ